VQIKMAGIFIHWWMGYRADWHVCFYQDKKNPLIEGTIFSGSQKQFV
jgi:hypothetical protein